MVIEKTASLRCLSERKLGEGFGERWFKKSRLRVEAEGKAPVQRKSLKMQDQKGIMNESGSQWRRERAESEPAWHRKGAALRGTEKREGNVGEEAEEFSSCRGVSSHGMASISSAGRKGRRTGGRLLNQNNTGHIAHFRIGTSVIPYNSKTPPPQEQ